MIPLSFYIKLDSLLKNHFDFFFWCIVLVSFIIGGIVIVYVDNRFPIIENTMAYESVVKILRCVIIISTITTSFLTIFYIFYNHILLEKLLPI